MPDQQNQKAMLNTTINKEVLTKFREYCKISNIPMNTVLEIFMTQFSAGQFTLKIAQSRSELEVKD